MQLASMRYVKIDGTAVGVTVASAAEARAALKELRHKKREIKFLRSALLRRQKAARSEQDKRKRPTSFLLRLFRGIRALGAALIDAATVAQGERKKRSPAEIERELQWADEVLHNIEGCILQLEGKLLTQAR
jgi:fructose-1,6-bisphosphatase/inositol monophosphatase family enzyme